MNNDTICAVATPAGRGGVGIIRISGDKSVKIASELFIAKNGKAVKDFEPSKLYYGRLDTGTFADSCLCVRFAAPHSFTGEDVIEFQCHGGTALLNGVIKSIIDRGARLAECGEFTKRAFINGRLDLSECEGLIDIINAESEAAVAAASEIAGGELSKKIENIQNRLKQLLSHAEVTIDFSEEDISEIEINGVKSETELIYNELKELADTFASGAYIKEGASVALCGKPNVGKSTLFNALLGYGRAIVTDIAGTTRDALEGQYTYNGVIFRVIDTAGIRESNEIIESKGIEISKKYIESADCVVFLAETGDFSEEDRQILKLIENKKYIKVLSKSDKGETCQQGFDIKISALTGDNVQKLKQMLYDTIIGKVYTGGLILTNYRHYDAVKRAQDIIKEISRDIDIMYIDMLAYNLRQAWETLGEVTGENSIESVIDNIFSRFCLGK